jgi:hypothetical protein
MDIKKDGVTHVDDLDNDFRDTKVAVQLSEEAVHIKQSPWTSSMWKLYGCLAIAYLCGCLNGYDGSLMVSLHPYIHWCCCRSHLFPLLQKELILVKAI